MGKKIVLDMDWIKKVELDPTVCTIAGAIDKLLLGADGWLEEVIKPLLEESFEHGVTTAFVLGNGSEMNEEDVSHEKELFVGRTLKKLNNG